MNAVPTVETEEGQAFLEQNQLFVNLSGSNLETVDQFAEHHAGGLFVLGRQVDSSSIYVKCHETWGPGKPDEPGDIVVHVYHYDVDTEEEKDVVRYYDDPADAIADFLLADESWLAS